MADTNSGPEAGGQPEEQMTADKMTSADSAGSPPVTTPPLPMEMRPKEIGGRDGPEPTRFGDWEKAGRCIDF